MSSERFVNRAEWRELFGALIALGLVSYMAWSIYQGGPIGTGAPLPDLTSAASLLLGVASALLVLQSQWVAFDDGVLVGRAWPTTVRISLEQLRLAAWVRAGKPKAKGKFRLLNGEVWLAHEDMDGGLAVSKVMPGPADAFLERLGEVAPSVRLLPPTVPLAEVPGWPEAGIQVVAARPVVATSATAAIVAVAPFLAGGAWYLSSIYSWAVGGPILSVLLWLLWGAVFPTVTLGERGISVPGPWGRRMLPWEGILALALARGLGGRRQLYIWSATRVPFADSVPVRVPKTMVAVGVGDTAGLFEDVALAAGLRVDGDIAYRV